MAEFHIVIPARMQSRRLPGKPLIQVAGKTLIELVYRRARQAAAQSIVIATDSAQIQDVATGFGATVVMTSPDHESGSDRIAECIETMGWPDHTVVVNLQGDEPLMPPACLAQCANLLEQSAAADVATLYWPIQEEQEVEDPNVVKAVMNEQGFALYFSRSVIPHPRNLSVSDAMSGGTTWIRHIGLYAYRAGALRAFSALQAGKLEQTERLEQLRFLESGRHIVMAQACEFIPAGVDTRADLERVRKLTSSSD